MEKNNELRNYSIIRYLSYWLYVLITLVTPIGLIAWQFEIFKQPGKMQITAYGIIAIILALYIMRGHLKQAIADMEYGPIRTLIQNVMRLAPMFIAWFILHFLQRMVAQVEFILLCTILGYIVAIIFDMLHTIMVIKCKQLKESNNK